MLRQVAEFLGCLLTRFAPQFVNRLKDFVPLICRDAFFAQKICPKFTVADSDNEIVRCKSEFTEDIDAQRDRKSTRLNSSHTVISYAVFCLKKKKKKNKILDTCKI